MARTGARMTRALGFAPELLPISGVSRFECFDVAQATVSEIISSMSVEIDQALDVDLMALSSQFVLNLSFCVRSPSPRADIRRLE